MPESVASRFLGTPTTLEGISASEAEWAAGGIVHTDVAGALARMGWVVGDAIIEIWEVAH